MNYLALRAAVVWLLFIPGLHAQVPQITTFTASPGNIHAAQNATLSWNVTGATALSIDNGIGTVTGTTRNVTPAVSTTYTLTATNGTGSRTTAVPVNVSPFNYILGYNSGLQGNWVRSCWEAYDGALFTNFAAPAPERTGNAIEVRFGAANAWNAFGLADRLPGYVNQYKYLNEMRTVEFDIYFESDSTGVENLTFILEDAGYSDGPKVVDLIPGWAGMTTAQRYGRWFHIAVNLASIHPTIPRFAQFLLFNAGEVQPHFRIADAKLGWLDDTTPPVVSLTSATVNATYTQLALAFTTDEAAIYRVEYGVGNYNQQIQGGSDDWTATHAATLTGLTPGTTVQYRIVAKDHRTNTAATPNQATLAGTYTLPSTPTTPPTISGLGVSGITGNRATVSWNTNRPCSAVVTYHKTGGVDFTRTLSDFTPSRTFVLDLLEPSTFYTVTANVTDAFNLSSSQSTTFTTGTSGAPTVTISVNVAAARAISPWIYGINFYESFTDAPRNLTLNRMGGNRWTAYNWENNASNAGNDYFYSSDGYMSASSVPGEAVRPIIAADRARGMASLMTVQLQGYVAADKNGVVDINDPNRFTTRFRQVIPRKGAAFTATPPTTDASVYMDEFLWALRGKFPGDIYADPVTPTFVSLDNEPELWPSTHAEIQTGPPSVASYMQKTVALASALKDLAPAVQIFGPCHYGFNGIVNWQNDPSFTDSNYWFTDKYLDDLKTASNTAGKRLLDVYDIHWYSEATVGGTRITDLTAASLSDAQVQAVVQSPRSLWDTTYTENSWVASYFGGPIRILGRLQSKIDARWPGTKLSLTEYSNGGYNHIAGAIAEADNLGVFGQLGIFAANFWPTSATYPFTMAGYKMYRDFDGNLGSFGDTSLPTVSSDTAKVAAYASRDSAVAGRYVIVALNRSTASQDVRFSGLGVAGRARVYRVEGGSAVPSFVGEVPADLATWIVTLPALSVSTIEIMPAVITTFSQWKASVFSVVEQANVSISGPSADPDRTGLTNLARYAFSLPARGPVASPVTHQTVAAGAQRFLKLEFFRRTQASDLTYRIESSDDLSGWTPLTTLAPGTPSQVTFQDTVPIGSVIRRFLRVLVLAAP